jgi:hypothetical protein
VLKQDIFLTELKFCFRVPFEKSPFVPDKEA